MRCCLRRLKERKIDMKAIRKTDGKVIEVREWRGASDVIYSELDMSAFYQDSDLDFSVNETKEAESEVISGWVARDMDGEIYLYENKPERGFDEWIGRSSSKFDFRKITWSSDPIEVEITIK